MRVKTFVENRGWLDTGLLLTVLAVVLLGAGTTMADLSNRLEQRGLLEQQNTSAEDKPSIAGAIFSMLDGIFSTNEAASEPNSESQSEEKEIESTE